MYIKPIKNQTKIKMLNTTHFNIQFLTKFYTKKDKTSLKTCHFETIP